MDHLPIVCMVFIRHNSGGSKSHPTHRIHGGRYIYLLIWKSTIHVGKYTSPMYGMAEYWKHRGTPKRNVAWWLSTPQTWSSYFWSSWICFEKKSNRQLLPPGEAADIEMVVYKNFGDAETNNNSSWFFLMAPHMLGRLFITLKTLDLFEKFPLSTSKMWTVPRECNVALCFGGQETELCNTWVFLFNALYMPFCRVHWITNSWWIKQYTCNGNFEGFPL